MAELDGMRIAPFVQEPRTGLGATIRSFVTPNRERMESHDVPIVP